MEPLILAISIDHKITPVEREYRMDALSLSKTANARVRQLRAKVIILFKKVPQPPNVVRLQVQGNNQSLLDLGEEFRDPVRKVA
jgi:hypothetical protein